MEIVEFQDVAGRSPFADWFETLEPQVAARVTVVLTRMQLGNLASVKSIGGGLLEARQEFGPGYRLYFGRDGATLIILLAGGTKRRQQADIGDARERWSDYKRRKKEAGR